MAATLYELNEDGEANGRVYYFCSPICRNVFTDGLLDIDCGAGESDDWITGTVCDNCGKTLAG